MSETIIWKVIEPIILKHGGEATRHEDTYLAGIPDISYGLRKVNGWIESKYINKWPKARRGVVRFRRYTTKQRNWTIRRQKAGGHCYIILLIGKDIKSREFIIFSGHLAKKLGCMSRSEMYHNCIWRGSDKELERMLQTILISWG